MHATKTITKKLLNENEGALEVGDAVKEVGKILKAVLELIDTHFPQESMMWLSHSSRDSHSNQCTPE